MQSVQVDIASAARSDAKVLVTGETGVGKELVARAIHQRSARHATPFVTINCAGVPDSLLESELFGHTRGSFTGAVRDHAGLLRQADGGTVFLDEVGEMSLRMQALLLRFLETGEIQTVGAAASHTHINVRVVTATNRDLREAATAREFRDDLYYRLNVFEICIPPLRARPDDIPLLLAYYLQLFADQHRRPLLTVAPPALDLLCRYAWPGNIRELRNVVERLVLRLAGPVIEPDAVPRDLLAARPPAAPAPPVDGSHQARVAAILDRLLTQHESFWTSAYPAFMARDITRHDLRQLIHTGLERTHGSYRLLVGLFNMTTDDYKRFLGFLKQHDCHLPFQRFRAIGLRSSGATPAGDRLSA
jgi:transcriptional regulator with GAF, ATPase, and Fis domain